MVIGHESLGVTQLEMGYFEVDFCTELGRIRIWIGHSSLYLSIQALPRLKNPGTNDSKKVKIQRGDPWLKKIFFRLRSQILFRLGLNDQKPGADSKNIYINVLCGIGCHRMTSHDIWWQLTSFDDIRCQTFIDLHVFGISTAFLIISAYSQLNLRKFSKK